MGKAESNQKATVLFNKVAGTVTDGTFTTYIDVRDCKRGSTLVNFTTGASGTLSLKVYTTAEEYTNELATAAKDTGNIFIDSSVNIFGTSAISGDSHVTDSLGLIGCSTFLKFVATIATSDSNTALYVKFNKTF